MCRFRYRRSILWVIIDAQIAWQVQRFVGVVAGTVL